MKHTRVLTATLLAVVPVTVASTAQAVPGGGPAPQVASAVQPAAVSAEGAGYADTILREVNELRASLGLGPVTRYAQLDAVAQGWSEQMVAQNSMSHNPGFADQYPGGWAAASENVAMRTGSGSTDIGSQLFDQWRNSPGHYANMTAPDVNAIGIGIAYDPATDSWYATQNFANYSDPNGTGLTRTGDGGGSTSTGSTEGRPTPKPSASGGDSMGSAGDGDRSTTPPASATPSGPATRAGASDTASPSASPAQTGASSSATPLVKDPSASASAPPSTTPVAPSATTTPAAGARDSALPVTGASLAAGGLALAAVVAGAVLLRVRRRAD